MANSRANRIDRFASDAAVLLLPRRRVRNGFVVALRILSGQAAIDAIVRHVEVEDGCYRHASLRSFDVTHRDAAQQRLLRSELVKTDVEHLVALVEERQNGIDRAAIEAVLELQVPLTLFRLPTKTGRAHRHLRRIGLPVHHQHLPLTVVDVGVGGDAIRAQELPRGVPVGCVAIELHEERRIGVLLQVIGEVRDRALVVILLEDHMIDGHPQRGVLPGLDRNPIVGVFSDLAEVRGDHDELAAVRARF